MEIRWLEDRCNRCLLCVKECVSGTWQEEDGLPVAAMPDLCNRCSHCVAVCPQDAIEHDALDTAQVRPVSKKLLNPESYREVVVSRRSVRQYKDKAVPREIIEKIIDVTRFSPTASNSQHVGYTVVTDQELLGRISKKIFGLGVRIYEKASTGWGKKILHTTEKSSVGQTLNRYMGPMDSFIEQAREGRDFILHHAPVLILIHAPKNAGFACDNCNIAAANLTNYAHALGLGTCYIGFLTLFLRFNKSFKKQLRIPEGRRVFASLILGYPAYRFSNTASRKPAEIEWIE